MGSNEERPKNIESVAYNIAGILEDIQRSPDKRMKEFVETCEDKNFLEKNFILNEINTRQYKKIKARYQKFCKAYLIKVFLEFIVEDCDIEIMLMLYGFLQGFDDYNKENRCQRYWEYAHTDNPRIIGKDRKSKCNLFNEIEEPIIKELSETLAAIMSKSNWKLNFVQEVYEEFINNKIPEKLALPITDYLQHNDVENPFNEETENTIDGNKIFSDTPLFVGQEDKKSLPHTNLSPKEGLSFFEIIKSKFAVKRKGKKIRAKFEVDFEIDIYDLKKENIDKIIMTATKKALTEVFICIAVFVVLPSIYLHITRTSEPNTQTDSDYVRTEPQQPTYPDTDKASDGGIKYDGQDIDSKLESSF